MRDERKKLVASTCRDESVEYNLAIFEQMKEGTEVGVRNCIRAKISVDNPNGTMRDPVMYRCNVETPHHWTGTAWKMYPTYELACPIVDSLEGVTHALRRQKIPIVIHNIDGFSTPLNFVKSRCGTLRE